jgi:DNA-binding winged helix-turn-helix (wHTH) protein/Tol biopolymer transport system component
VNELVRHPVYAFEGFRLDAQRRLLFGPNGKPIVLTPRLLDALLYLVEHGGQLLTKEQLLEAIWPNVVVEEHNLNKTVSELRRILGEKPGEHRFIVTKPGRGYRFVADVSLVAHATAVKSIAPTERAADVPVREPCVPVPAIPDATPPRAPKRHRRRAATRWGAGAIAIATALLVAFLPGPSEQPLRITPWSVQKGTQWFPAWSPDSASAAFVTFGGVSGELPELVIRDMNEPIARRLARRPADDPGGVTQWTTTGRILHLDLEGLWSSSPVGGPSELIAQLDYERLGIGNLWLRMVDVSRDGSALAAFGRDGADSVTIWTATPPGAMPTRYEPAPFTGAVFFNAPFLRFSPSGRQLLLVFYAAGRGPEAWLMPFPPDPRNPPRRVFDTMPINGGAEFSWLPDDRHVVLSSAIGAAQANPRPQLYLADTRSGSYRSLPATFTHPGLPVVAPDGSKLLVMDQKREFDIVTLDLATLTLTRTIATDRSEILPAWAADANAMVYASDRSGTWEIWLRREPQADRPLVTARDFPTPSLLLFAPTLSPDGERVVFHRVGEADESRLWIAAVAGGRPEPLTTEQLTERAGSWSPDGEWYVYWASPREGGARALKKVRTTGRATPETLLEDLRLTSSTAPIWSPDGRWVLVAHDGLTLLSLYGEPSRKLGTEAMPCAFADGEPLLHCIRGNLGAIPVGEYALLELDFDGNVRRARTLPPAYRPVSAVEPGIRLSPTPDRRGVTYSVEEVSRTLWLVEGLDRVTLP